MDVTTGCTWNSDLRLWVAAAPEPADRATCQALDAAVSGIVRHIPIPPEPVAAVAAVTLEQWQAAFGTPEVPDQDLVEEQAITDARLIAALESDREALRRVIDGLAARLVVAEANASAAPPVVAIEPPNPLVWAVAAHPWLRDPKATWRMGGP